MNKGNPQAAYSVQKVTYCILPIQQEVLSSIASVTIQRLYYLKEWIKHISVDDKMKGESLDNDFPDYTEFNSNYTNRFFFFISSNYIP